MIAINKEEKEAVVSRFPEAHVVRTMKTNLNDIIIIAKRHARFPSLSTITEEQNLKHKEAASVGFSKAYRRDTSLLS